MFRMTKGNNVRLNWVEYLGDGNDGGITFAQRTG